MAPADVAQRRGTQLGSRLSAILQELQKRQTTEAPAVLEAHKSKRLSFVPEVTVAIMGVTGAGKSSFIRKVTANEEVQVGDSLRSSMVMSFVVCTLE
jgi:predicted GTPase